MISYIITCQFLISIEFLIPETSILQVVSFSSLFVLFLTFRPGKIFFMIQAKIIAITKSGITRLPVIEFRSIQASSKVQNLLNLVVKKLSKTDRQMTRYLRSKVAAANRLFYTSKVYISGFFPSTNMINVSIVSLIMFFSNSLCIFVVFLRLQFVFNFLTWQESPLLSHLRRSRSTTNIVTGKF